jgi:hypothetical protein
MRRRRGCGPAWIARHARRQPLWFFFATTHSVHSNEPSMYCLCSLRPFPAIAQAPRAPGLWRRHAHDAPAITLLGTQSTLLRSTVPPYTALLKAGNKQQQPVRSTWSDPAAPLGGPAPCLPWSGVRRPCLAGSQAWLSVATCGSAWTRLVAQAGASWLTCQALLWWAAALAGRSRRSCQQAAS